jgi:hypothetical protein
MKTWLDPRRLPELYDLTGKKPRKSANPVTVTRNATGWTRKPSRVRLENPTWDFKWDPSLFQKPFGQVSMVNKRWLDTMLLHHQGYLAEPIAKKARRTLQGMLSILDEEVR